jgi:hypothetical protein
MKVFVKLCPIREPRRQKEVTSLAECPVKRVIGRRRKNYESLSYACANFTKYNAQGIGHGWLVKKGGHADVIGELDALNTDRNKPKEPWGRLSQGPRLH